MFYPKIDHCLKIHDKILEISGGKSGVANLGYLETVLQFIQSDIYYPDFIDKLTYTCLYFTARLVITINKNHAFIDGNKRSSIAISELFLKLNGYDYVLPIFATIMEDIAVGVADNLISQEILKDILWNILEGFDMTEEQKLIIIHIKQLILKLKNNSIF